MFEIRGFALISFLAGANELRLRREYAVLAIEEEEGFEEEEEEENEEELEEENNPKSAVGGISVRPVY